MKKNILAMAVILNCSFAMAQTEFDALKMIQPDINGTARYMGMAGAFGALGGDASAIKDNPAGLGIYRSSEITTTLDLSLQSSKSVWNGTTANDNLDNLRFNNFSYVKATPTYRSLSGDQGLLSSNWSFSYNRLKSFNRNSTVKSGQSSSSISDYMAYFTQGITSSDLTYVPGYEPFNNINIPWISIIGYENGLIKQSATNDVNSWVSNINTMVIPTYTLHETGYIDEYSIGWAGNFSNRFYLGTTLNVQSVNYNARSVYSETYGGGNTYLDNNISTTGTGVNLNIGAIVRPIDMLRLGVSIHTPTIYSMTDNHYTNYNDNAITQTAPSTNYQLSSPWKFNGSAAVIIGQKGLISMEYDYALNSNAKFYDEDGNAQSFSYENTGIKTMLKDIQTIKVGAEYRLTENFSLRAGYAYMNGATNNEEAHKVMIPNTSRTDTEYFQNNRTDYITAGFGYREANWYIDFAYMNKSLDETFYPYNLTSVNSASVKTTTNNLIVTLGLKF